MNYLTFSYLLVLEAATKIVLETTTAQSTEGKNEILTIRYDQNNLLLCMKLCFRNTF